MKSRRTAFGYIHGFPSKLKPPGPPKNALNILFASKSVKDKKKQQHSFYIAITNNRITELGRPNIQQHINTYVYTANKYPI
jgi:hypothetical protein